MAGIVNFFKGQASSLVNAFSYGLTHLDQFSTAGDVIVVQHPDGTLHSTPFNVRFGKISVPRPSTKIVRIEVNGEAVTSVMKLKSDGTAYFVESTTGGGASSGSPDHSGLFPVSPSQSPISPVRSPTVQSAGNPPNSPPAEDLTLDLDAGAASAKSSTKKSDNNHNNATRPFTMNSDGVVTLDEGSAIELAKQNPEIRDLVTSIVGESRAGEREQRINNDSIANNGNTPPTVNIGATITNSPNGDAITTSTPMHRQHTGNISANDTGSNINNNNNTTNDGGESTSNSVSFANNNSLSGGSFAGSKPAAGLRLARFASSNNIDTFHKFLNADDDFAALVQQINEKESEEDFVKQQQKNSDVSGGKSLLHLAASASKVGVNIDGAANILNEVGGSAESTYSGVSDDKNNKTGTAGEQVQYQPTTQEDDAAANRHQLQYQLESLIPDGSQLIEDDEYVDDSSDEDYDYFLQSAPQQQQQQQQKLNSGKNLLGKVAETTTSETTKKNSNNTTTAAATTSSNDVNDTSVLVHDTSSSSQHVDPLDTTGVIFSEMNNTNTSTGNNSASSQTKKASASYHATITPGHNELAKLNLKDGANIVKFIVYSQTLTRATEVEARIFLWPYTAKVVISDIDGTVTKSDVMGHLSAILRWDWTHPGLCSLYTNIAKNEYKFLYLTARSLSQTSSTRAFLENVAQDGQKLPDGPVFTATEKLFAALTQEVLKRSHIFKTECLTTVRQIFPKSLRHPLYAGFGNRIGDSIAYENVGIPLHKIFIIDESSVVHVCKVKQTYRDLAHLVDMTFPPISGKVPVEASQLPIHYSNVTVVSGQVRSSSSLSFSQLAQAGSTSSLNGGNSYYQQHQQRTSPTLSFSDQSGNNLNAMNSATVSPQPSSGATGFFPAHDSHGNNSNNNRNQKHSPEGAYKNNGYSNSTMTNNNSNYNNNGPVAPPMSCNSASSAQNEEDIMMEEKVDFNDFNFWRVEPSSLTTPKTSGKKNDAATSATSSQQQKAGTDSNKIMTMTSSSSPARPAGGKPDTGIFGSSSGTTTAASTTETSSTATSTSNQPVANTEQQATAQSAGWFSSLFGRGAAATTTTTKPATTQPTTSSSTTTTTCATTTTTPAAVTMLTIPKLEGVTTTTTTPWANGSSPESPREAKSGIKRNSSGLSTPRSK